MIRRLSIIFILSMLIASQVAAADLSRYHERVFKAAEMVRQITEEGEDIGSGIDQIRALLPKSEKVEAGSQSITVDNTWLHQQLDECEKEQKAQKRIQKLSNIGDRLDAIDDQLHALEDSASTASATKDQREKIHEILSRSAYLEKKDDPLTSYLKETRRKIIDFLSNLFRKIFGAVVGAGGEANVFFLVLIVIAIGAAIIIALKMFAQDRGPKKSRKKRSVLGEEIEEGVSSADLASLALAAARSGDFRSAIRKLYISLLYELAERNLIEIEPQTTNHEYLARISKFGALVAPMRYMTDRFDYFWYGMFPSSEEDFKAFLERYSEAMNRARVTESTPAKA